MANGVVFVLEDGSRIESKHQRSSEKMKQLKEYLREGTLRVGTDKVVEIVEL